VRASRIACYLLIASLVAPVAVLGGAFDRAIDSALPRVVKLYGLGVGAQAGYGTGVVVSSDGLVLTVLSLLIDARRVRAVTADGTHYEAEVVHRDNARQLALLRLKPPDQGGDATAKQDSVNPFEFFDLACEAAAVDQAMLRPGLGARGG